MSPFETLRQSGHRHDTPRDVPLELASRSEIARWAPIPLRLIVGYGFMEHGFAKLAKRLAANHAIDRPVMNQAETLGFSRITWGIIPSSFEFYWQPPGYPYDPARAAASR